MGVDDKLPRDYLTALVIFPLLFSATIAHAKSYSSYDTISLTVLNDSGLKKATLNAWIADTPKKRFLGLSGSETLPAEKGMLFVYKRSSHRTFTMRNMHYGLDILFIDEDSRIRKIRTLPPPGSNPPSTETGFGRYVLEVPAGWTERHSIQEGQSLKRSIESDHFK